MVMDWHASQIFCMAHESPGDLDRCGLRVETVSNPTARLGVADSPECGVDGRVGSGVALALLPARQLKGGRHGYDLQDWLEAERIVRGS